MYLFAAPAAPLLPFIECYWFVLPNGGTTAISEVIFVDGQTDILFNFGCSYQRWRLRDGVGQCALMPHPNLDAQRRFPVVIEQQGQIHLVGVRFHPGGLTAFLRLPLHEITDQTLPVGDVFGSAAGALEAQLFDVRCDTARLKSLLDEFFLQRLCVPDSYALVTRLCQYIERGQGNEPISALSRDSGYSLRSLDRMFSRSVGFGPKFYARIVRFRGALRTIALPLSITGVAQRNGYYDHAHFTREFSAFSGMTPRQYRLFLQTRALNAAPNLVRFLQDARLPGE